MEELTPFVESSLRKALDEDLTGLKLLCEWALYECAYPHSVARPTNIGRRIGVRKANIRQKAGGAGVKSVINGSRLIVMYEDGETDYEHTEPLSSIVERLKVAGINIELEGETPAVEPEPTTPMGNGGQALSAPPDPADRIAKPDQTGEVEEFDGIEPHIKNQKMLLQFVFEIPNRAERVFAKRRVAQYIGDFPELTMAPDEMLLTSLMMVELQMYRLQQEISRGEDVPPARIGAVQSQCQNICASLGITRAQRLKYGERGGASIADLVADIDNLQQEALKRFQADLVEEEPIVATAMERIERELAPGEAETVLQQEFGIEINSRTGEFAQQKSKDE